MRIPKIPQVSHFIINLPYVCGMSKIHLLYHEVLFEPKFFVSGATSYIGILTRYPLDTPKREGRAWIKVAIFAINFARSCRLKVISYVIFTVVASGSHDVLQRMIIVGDAAETRISVPNHTAVYRINNSIVQDLTYLGIIFLRLKSSTKRLRSLSCSRLIDGRSLVKPFIPDHDLPHLQPPQKVSDQTLHFCSDTQLSRPAL